MGFNGLAFQRLVPLVRGKTNPDRHAELKLNPGRVRSPLTLTKPQA